MPERSRFFPGYDGRLHLIVGPRTKFRAKSCANAGLLNWFDGVCKVNSGFSQLNVDTADTKGRELL